MSFFDSLISTPEYQSQIASKQFDGQPSGLLQQPMPQMPQMPAPVAPQPMVPQPIQNMAKGGLSAANDSIKQVQTMKVIAHYFKNLGIPQAIGMQGLQKEIAQGLQLIPYESSVMGYKKLGDGTAQIHFFTVGTVKSLADDMRYFIKYLKDHGIRTIYDTLPAPITTDMLVKSGWNLEKSENPKYKLKASL
jgi:hypothetical protein